MSKKETVLVAVEELPGKLTERYRYLDAFHQSVLKLTAEEGDSVRFVNPNPDFDGPNNVIFVERGGSPAPAQSHVEEEWRFTGDTLLECLQQAVAARECLLCGGEGKRTTALPSEMSAAALAAGAVGERIVCSCQMRERS